MPPSDISWRQGEAIMAIRMKRIIEGRTYNTETATEVASWSGFTDPEAMRAPESGAVLYQTRHGAYFLVSFNEALEPWEDGYEKLTPLDPEQAQRWAEKHCSTEEVERLFGEQPEAGDAEAKLTLRMPEALRRRLVLLAESRKQSLNAWIVRCLETCAEAAAERRP
jgi:HicB family